MANGQGNWFFDDESGGLKWYPDYNEAAAVAYGQNPTAETQAAAQPFGADPVYPGDAYFLAGGTPTIPATAQPAQPADISPQTFAASDNVAPAGTVGGNVDTINQPITAPTSTLIPPTSRFALPGWDMTKWNTPGYSDPKYDLGHALSPYAPTPENLQKVIAGMPGFSYLGGDLVRMPDGTVVDAIYDIGGAGAHWQFSGPSGAAAPMTTAGAATATTPAKSLLPSLSSLLGSIGGGGGGGTGGGGLNLVGQPLQPGVNQVGQDDFSVMLDNALQSLISGGGSTPFGNSISATLADIISHGGNVPGSNGTEQSLNAARDAEAQAYSGQLADAKNSLADRGLMAIPGQDSGSQNLAINRITQSLAQPYSGAVAGIEQHAMDLANTNLNDALSLATGMSRDQTNAILGSIGSGTQRQQVLSQIALDTLAQNTQWNEFLATYGLQKDQIAEQLAQGRITSLVPLLQLFLQLSQQSSQGFIGS